MVKPARFWLILLGLLLFFIAFHFLSAKNINKKNMNYILEIPELLETIFAFLSRKDLYRSCARVNHQWNAVSKLIIRKKRKAEFISIPSIRDNIIFHLYDDHLSLTEIVNYCKVSDIWSNILNRLSARTISLSMLYHHKAFLNAFRYSKRRFLYNKK